MARGRSYDRQTSYAVLAGLLRSAFGIRQADEESVARAGIEGRVHELGLDLDHATVRLLLDVLGYASAGVDPPTRRRVLYEVVGNPGLRQGGWRPLLLVDRNLNRVCSARPIGLSELCP